MSQVEETGLKDRTPERRTMSPPDRALPKEMQCHMSICTCPCPAFRGGSYHAEKTRSASPLEFFFFLVKHCSWENFFSGAPQTFINSR